MGIFDFLKDAASETPLEFRAHCPVCNQNTNQIQKGILGQSTVRICIKCKSAWEKQSNGEWVRTQ